MDFIRARNNEQKNIRLNQIVAAALEVYETEPYDKITLASIAKKLDFSRANLYKYVASKEEIFLLVISCDLNSFIEDIRNTFTGLKPMGIEDFSLRWSETLYRHERLLQLCAILFTIIEKKVTVGSLSVFKKQLFASIDNLYPLLKNLLVNISDKQILKFLNYQLHYAAGLYPSTVQNEIQKEAIRLSGVPYEIEDFVSAFADFLAIILKGMCSDSDAQY